MIKPIRSLTDIIGMLSRGNFTAKCDEALASAVAALENLPEEKGTATLTLTIALTRIGDRLELRPKIATKLPPEKDMPSTVFWPIDGALSVQHPSQFDMFERGKPPIDRNADPA